MFCRYFETMRNFFFTPYNRKLQYFQPCFPGLKFLYFFVVQIKIEEQQMTSMVNGGNEDLNKAEGHIELRIENFAGFSQEKEGSQRLSEPVYVRGVPWKIVAESGEYYNSKGQLQKYLGYYLRCNRESTDPLWSCSATVQFKVLAQREGSVDHVREFSQSRLFHAKATERGFRHMTFEELMKPDRGWYDEQADCIVLAVDLKADVVGRVAEYVSIAENELKLDKATTSSYSMKIGHLEWEFHSKTNSNKNKVLTVHCKEMVKAGIDENYNKMALELFGYQREDPKSEIYSPLGGKPGHRHYFITKNDARMTVDFSAESDDILFTVRLLKERSQFPDFTKPAAMVGCIPADIKLRVDDHVFHVNKLLLCFHSDYFDLMFNGSYKEANQAVVELKHEEAKDPALFHDFLLVMCVPEVLPNTRNVVGLLKLAQHYQAEEVTEKCMKHLRICREMPLEQRVLLTGEYGDKESRASILDNLSNAESKQMNAIFLEKMFTLYSPQK